ncbi:MULTISPECIES: EAL domain-containing protein [Rhodomicrobium]|uniref:EAL domain-containing protein n=1 Tax=Rhodomicrobium TaxID=1068 RepID=UPI001FDA1998|nr:MULTISPECIES: EAL domain-containing protein [Rhodomicrobium]
MPITMAFQPIVNVEAQQIFGHEALVRGPDGQGAGYVLEQVSDDNRYAFDQLCRTTAIELAAKLDISGRGECVSINFLPNAVYEPTACIQLTLAAALRTGFPLDRIIFEFTESESYEPAHILNILQSYRAQGLKTAIDDFGAGYAGLGLLTKFQPDLVKLDMELIRDIDTNSVKRTVVKNTLAMLRDLGINTICEGVETIGEYDVLRDLDVCLMQGFLFARPALSSLAIPAWPDHA